MSSDCDKEFLSRGVPLRDIHLARDEQRLGKFIEALPVAVFVTDAEGKPCYSNVHSRKLLGKGVVLGATAETLAEEYKAYLAGTSIPYPTERMPIVRALRGTASTVDDMEIQAPEGRISLRVDGVPLFDPEGAVTFAIAVFHDITEERRLQMSLRVADRMASVGMVAAGVAHEINNPLSYIVSNIAFVTEELKSRGEVGQNEFLEALEEARVGAERVRVIVRDLKTFSRQEVDTRGAVDVVRTFESSISMAWSEIRHRAKLVKVLGNVSPVSGNSARLGQVFLNLLVNAAQAIPEGRANTNEIRAVTRMGSKNKVIVEISDTGAGIPPEVLPRIFDPFFTTKSVGIGTGLGLGICKNIVTGLGGEMEVETEIGKGSLFRVILNVANEDALNAEEAGQPQRSTLKHLRVLLVDDEPLIGEALKRMMRGNHEVITLASAKDALQRVRSGETVSLIISDLMMPDMTGIDLYHELEKTHSAQARRMVFLTGGSFSEQSRAFLNSISNLHLEKPVDAQTLWAVIHQYARSEKD